MNETIIDPELGEVPVVTPDTTEQQEEELDDDMKDLIESLPTQK